MRRPSHEPSRRCPGAAHGKATTVYAVMERMDAADSLARVNMSHVPDELDELRARVRAERTARGGMSVRTAAAAGGISNETWGKFENGAIDVTSKVRQGVSQAFGWDEDWPENPPAMPRVVIDELRDEIASLRGDVATMARLLEEFVRTARRSGRDRRDRGSS